MQQVIVPAQTLAVNGRYDICVIGGSCTGVFAAIRAARLGAKVIIVEKQNRFGGVAVSSLVNIWHSMLDTDYRQTVIAGLTAEMLERLQKRAAVRFVPENPSIGAIINTDELAIELDEVILEAGVMPLFHTVFSEPFFQDGKISGIIVENKSGRSVILADYFIDASGDGDLCHRAGFADRLSSAPQPPTTCAHFSGWEMPIGFDLDASIRKYAAEYKLPAGFIWGEDIPGSSLYMLAGTRVFNCDCSDAADLSAAEIEGRRQIRVIMDILKNKCGFDRLILQALPSMIGIRESRHIEALYRLTGNDLLHGVPFDDAIANGTYRVDIHQPDRPGVVFRYLDGREIYICPGLAAEESRWRGPVDHEPKFYQIPLRSLIPRGATNVISAGRMIDADAEAYGAVRVMVNLNQTGEAAGVAAALALQSGAAIGAVSAIDIRSTLNRGGSCV